MSECGLVISSKHPFMGSSLDGLLSCECCGSGILEVKCPYSCRDKSFSKRMEEAEFFLEKSDY